MRTRKVTWIINEKSLAENAKANIAVRHRPNIKNATFSVFQVWPWFQNNKRLVLAAKISRKKGDDFNEEKCTDINTRS